jgi:hypothetical protein
MRPSCEQLVYEPRPIDASRPVDSRPRPVLTPAIGDRPKRIGPLLAAIFLLALTCAASAGAFSTDVTYHYRSGDPSAKLQRGIAAFSFAAATVNGRAKDIVPEDFLVPGFGGGTVLKAAFGISAELTCEEEGHTNPALAGYFVQNGKDGLKLLRVRGNRFRYRGPAFDGSKSTGRIEIRGRFTRHSKVASGTLLVKGAKAQTVVGGEGTNCHTGSGAKPKPLKWRLHGDI